MMISLFIYKRFGPEHEKGDTDLHDQDIVDQKLF